MNVMMTKQIGFYFAIVVCGVLGIAPAQECVIRDNGCLYGVEGSCVPRRTTYGYYETHWRNWPFAQPPRIPARRPKRSFLPAGTTALPEAEVPRPTDEASISPELPNKQEELAPFVPGTSPDQIDIDRQTDPFEDDLRTPAADVPGNEGQQINPFEGDLKTPAADVPGNERQTNPFDDLNPTPGVPEDAADIPKNLFENDLRTPAVETPADDAGAMRLGPHRFNPTRLAPNTARGRNLEMARPQYGRFNPLRVSFEKAKPKAVNADLQAAQAVALEEVTPRAKRVFHSHQVDAQQSTAVSNPLRR